MTKKFIFSVKRNIVNTGGQDDQMIEHMEQKKIGDCPQKRVRPLFLVVKFLTVNDHDIKIGQNRSKKKL